MTNDNHIIVDLNKVQYASFYYRAQFPGIVRRTKPKGLTVRGRLILLADLEYHTKRPLLEVAMERGLLDKWEPVCRMILTANKSLSYTGTKATKMWKAWQTKIFKKGK